MVSSLQAAGTHAAGETAQVEHSGPCTHHQLYRRDGLGTAATTHRKQTEERDGAREEMDRKCESSVNNDAFVWLTGV